MLEDLHWVDKASEELLGILAEDVSGAPIFLLAAYRPGYHPPWLDKSYAGQIPLNPLSREDSLRVVRSVVRAERVADQVTEEIVAKADGNPLFLEQLALHAGEARDLRSLLMVPDTIHDVVMAKTDRLPEETKQLLQTAAVIGREVPFRLLRAICGERHSLLSHLRELNRLDFVYERIEPEGAVYVFRHALTQETVYEACSSGIAAAVTAPSDTRSKSCSPAVPTKSQKCWLITSIAATSPRRRSISRYSRQKKRNVVGPIVRR